MCVGRGVFFVLSSPFWGRRISSKRTSPAKPVARGADILLPRAWATRRQSSRRLKKSHAITPWFSGVRNQGRRRGREPPGGRPQGAPWKSEMERRGKGRREVERVGERPGASRASPRLKGVSGTSSSSRTLTPPRPLPLFSLRALGSDPSPSARLARDLGGEGPPGPAPTAESGPGGRRGPSGTGGPTRRRGRSAGSSGRRARPRAKERPRSLSPWQ